MRGAAPTVLIVTQKDYDLHAAVVADDIARLGGEVRYWDIADLPRMRSAFAPADATGALGTGEAAIDIAALRSVWWRRPGYLQMPELSGDYLSVVEEEWKFFAAGLWSLLEALAVRVVSPPNRIREAESKIRQLQVARQLGLRLPATIVTNDYEAFRDFHDETGGSVIAKKLKSHQIIKDERHGAIFVTRRVTPASFTASELALCPVIFQQELDIRYDVRLVVIGGESHAFRIDTGGRMAGQLDYRALQDGIGELPHELYDPPASVTRKCIDMTRRLGLEFGAFDFAIDRDGRHVFLELNPNGQWLWLQLATKFPLSERIAGYLVGAPD